MPTQSTDDVVVVWLERSAAWSFASLALQLPDPARIDEMSSLVPSLAPDLRPLARAVVAPPFTDWEGEFFAVLGPGGNPASESSYERAAIATRGPLLADVAGYYEAFAYRPQLQEVPDHAAVELGFAAFLALKIAFAAHEGRVDESSVAVEACHTFLSAHLDSWLGCFCDALTASGSTRYIALARYLSHACPTRPLHSVRVIEDTRAENDDSV